MNEEEKNAVERIEDTFYSDLGKGINKFQKITLYEDSIKDVRILLNLIEKLQKENEELKQDRNNNYQMIALAQNEVLGYMQGYEDGKKLKRSAVACVVENQQYYIIKKEIEHYKEYIEKLQKENEELKNKLLDTLEGQKVIKEETPQYIKENFIPVQKIKDKIEKLNDESHAEELEDIMIGKNYTITELVQYVLQELIEESEEK
jgi:hypothetical protein